MNPKKEKKRWTLETTVGDSNEDEGYKRAKFHVF